VKLTRVVHILVSINRWINGVCRQVRQTRMFTAVRGSCDITNYRKYTTKQCRPLANGSETNRSTDASLSLSTGARGRGAVRRAARQRAQPHQDAVAPPRHHERRRGRRLRQCRRGADDGSGGRQFVDVAVVYSHVITDRGRPAAVRQHDTHVQ